MDPVPAFDKKATTMTCRDSTATAVRSRRPRLGGCRVLPLLIGIVAFEQSACAACTGDLSPDRPGFSTGTGVLAPGCQEIEFGVQATRDEATSLHDITAPLLLYRAGLGPRWEIRAAWDGISRTVSAGRHRYDANDSSLGVKYRLHDGPAWSFSLLGELSLPTGSRALSSKGYDPAAGLLWSRALNDKDSLSGTVRIASLSDDGHRATETSFAIDISHAFSARWGGFLEFFAARDAGDSMTDTLDGGVTYLVGNDLQLDINAGFGLNANADDRFLGAGAAWRF